MWDKLESSISKLDKDNFNQTLVPVIQELVGVNGQCYKKVFAALGTSPDFSSTNLITLYKILEVFSRSHNDLVALQDQVIRTSNRNSDITKFLGPVVR